MTRNYLVEAVEPCDPITHYDFFRPRKSVTLVRVDDGEVLRVQFPASRNWRRGDVVVVEDFELAAALQSSG